MKTFLWSILQGALPLGENLLKRGGISDGNCSKCQSKETAEHCFFTCPFAKKVWQCIPLLRPIAVTNGSQLPEILAKFRTSVCLPPTGIATSILPWILWAIWTSRNTAIFEGRHLSPEDTASKGLRLAQEWSQSQGPSRALKISKQTGTLPTARLHQPPGASIGRAALTCNSDAAWNKDSLCAGFGWIIDGPPLHAPICGSSSQDFVGSPLIAEALAMRSALLVAASMELFDLRVFSDNSTLIRALSSNHQSKEIIGIVHDLRVISSAFASISFSFVPRLDNASADLLAKRALQTHSALY